MDNTNGGKIVDGTRFFTAGAGDSDKNPEGADLNTSVFSQEIATPETPTSENVPIDVQRVGNAALSNHEELRDESHENETDLVNIEKLMPPTDTTKNDQEEAEKNHSENTPTSLYGNNMDEMIKAIEEAPDPRVLQDFLNDAWQKAEGKAA